MNNTGVALKRKKHEPFVTISRRSEISLPKAFLIRGVVVCISVIFSAVVVMLISGKNPIAVFSGLIKGALGLPGSSMMIKMKLDTLFKNVAFLLGISLAVTPAFKMKFWNTGAEGQVLIGALTSIFLAEMFGRQWSQWVLLPVMLVASIIMGAIWAGIPGFFKAKWNTNETLFTLMMNYVAMQLVKLFIAIFVRTQSGIYPTSPENSHFPTVIPQITSFFPVIIVAVLTVGIYIYLKKSKQGYEISVVGESENTARYIGINVKKVIIRTVIISGAICGLMGWVLACSDHSINTNTVGGNGFTAIMVSWMSQFNPLVMIFSSFLISFLKCGTTGLSSDQSIGDIVTGIIILFVISAEFFINYKVVFHFKKRKEGAK